MTPIAAIAILDVPSQLGSEIMEPIHGERGKYYYALKCQNPTCGEKLLLIEIPAYPSDQQRRDSWNQLQDPAVRCPICTQKTPIEQRLLFVLEVR